MKRELIIGRGEEAQQSQEITDLSVSRKHLLLTETAIGQKKTYHIRLLSQQNVLYVNGMKMTECDINENDTVQLGKNKLILDISQAIADIGKIDFSEQTTELPTQISLCQEQEECSEQQSFLSVDAISRLNFRKWFGIMNVVVGILLLLSVLLRSHQTAHTFVILMLVGALLIDIWLFTKKQN